MHLLAVLPLVCLFFCPANGLLATHTASQASPQSTAQQSSSSRPSSSSRSFMSNRTSLSNQQPSSSQSLSTSFVLTSNSQRSPSTQVSSLTTGNNTSWLADDTKLPSLRTGKDNSRFAANGNSSSPLNTTTSLRTGKDTTKLAAYGNSTSPLNTTLREDFTPRSLTYIVWTLDSEDEDGNEVIWNSFIGLGVDGSNINILGPPPGLSSVDGFELVLNTEQRKELKVEGNIDFIAQACETGCQDISDFIADPPATKNDTSDFSKRDFTMQIGRPWDMAYISQPKMTPEGIGASMIDINGRYAYDQSSATGVTIYMVDSGANPDHVEFSHIRQTWEWAGLDYTRTRDGGYPAGVQADYAGHYAGHVEPGHGTMMLSKIAGINLGVVKNPSIVIVRKPPHYGPVQALQNIEYVLWHWKNVRNDGRNKVGIISLSLSFWDLGETNMRTKNEEKALGNIKKRMAECIAAGLLPITSSGNDGGPVNIWPALFRSTDNWGYMQPNFRTVPLPQLVVVGATDNDGKIWDTVDATGKRWASQTADFVDLTAPGVSIYAASSFDPTGYVHRSGTSQACAETAGLAAYFAGLVSVNGGWRASTPISQRLNAVRNKLLSSAYPRTLNDPAQYPLGVWNGMNYIPARPNTNEVPICGYDYTNQKRDAACAYDPGSPATNSSTSPPQSSSISPAQSSSISPPQSSTTSTPPTRATKAAYKPLASPNTNIQYTNLTVQTGNLFGPAINKVITDGLEGICPPTADGVFASCNDGEPFSQNVEYLVPGDGNYIILEANSTFTIPLSNYSSTAKRDAMIAVIAAFMENQAKQGSANCQTNTSSWWDDDCTPENGKREEGSGPGSNPGSKCERFDTMTYCQVPASVQLEITEDNLVVDYMTIDTSFTIEGLGLLNWLCNEFSDFTGDFMEYLAPELATEYPQIIGDIDTSCVKELNGWIG